MIYTQRFTKSSPKNRPSEEHTNEPHALAKRGQISPTPERFYEIFVEIHIHSPQLPRRSFSVVEISLPLPSPSSTPWPTL